MTEYAQQWQVPSSDGERTYVVSVTLDDVWSCSCTGWTHHMPRRDCKHIVGVKGRTPGARSKPSAVSAMTARAALKSGANREEAADVARVKREEVQAKKVAKLGKLRYGFQLAHTYEPADLERGEWVAEVKYDGELAMLIDGRLVNRSGNDVTGRFPEIEKPERIVLVGELCIFDESTGLTVFNKIQERNTDDALKVKLLSTQQPATFVVFDMLETLSKKGRPGVFADFPFSERRAALETLFPESPRNVRLADQIPVKSDRDVRALVKKMAELGGEGFMLKRLDAPYVAKRGRNWVKAKTWQEREFDVARFEDTGIGDGFVIYVVNKGRECRVNCGSFQMREKIRRGHKRVELKFLSESEDGALRFPSVRRLT